MATKLDKPLVREVSVKDAYGCDGAVNVTITADGIALRGKGTQRALHIGWEALAAAASAPANMPAKFGSNKLGWLVQKTNPKTDME